MTVLPTERHDIVRKLLFLLHFYVNKDLLKATVIFQLVHPIIMILVGRKCLKMSSDGKESRWGVSHLLLLQVIFPSLSD